jgi:hypothetical protein
VSCVCSFIARSLTDLRAVKMNLANEGLEARMKDEEVAGKKRKAEDDKVWEGMFLPLYSSSVTNPLQIRGISAWIAGVLSPTPRRRRRPRLRSSDEHTPTLERTRCNV